MKNRILIVVDFSNFMYYTIAGCFSFWMKKSVHSSIIKPAKETDQDNLPDLLVYEDFRRDLHNYVHKRLGTVDWIVKQNHQEDVDMCEHIDVIFSMDDKITNNFRKKKYPGYKAQRKLVNKQYDIDKVKEYVNDIILPELQLETDLGYNFIRVDGCESDDIIATIMNNFKDYKCRILISSDHDFLQLDDVYQYDMAGNPIQRKVCDEDVTAKDFLLWKIIRGDVSDNISGVFKGVGEKKSLNLVKDKAKLKSMLLENYDSARQYELNKYLIDFKNIPQDRVDEIVKRVNEIVSKNIVKKNMINDDMLSF